MISSEIGLGQAKSEEKKISFQVPFLPDLDWSIPKNIEKKKSFWLHFQPIQAGTRQKEGKQNFVLVAVYARHRLGHSQKNSKNK